MSQDGKPFDRADAENLVRQWNLLYNRVVAYSFNHPVAQETVPKVHEAFLRCLGGPDGSLSLLFQEVGYFIGHVDLAYQANNRRIADHLRRFGIEAISVTGPLSAAAFGRFLDACSLTHANPAGFVAYLVNQGVQNFSVNNVSLQTVKEGEAVITQTMARPGGPTPASADRPSSSPGAPKSAGAKNTFDDLAMKVVLGHLTAQEMSANLGILKMLESPTALPDALLKASSATAGAANPGGQAEAMRQSLLNVVGAFRAEAGQGSASVEDLLAGMYNMRAELLKAVKAQQGLAQHLSSKEEVAKAADDVFITTAAQLVMSEYQRCKGNPKRMAQVIQRIVPDRNHLQKVLAVFRADLQKQGTPLTEFYSFLTELNTLLGADQSYREFLQAGQDLGVSPDELLRELQADPRQAAHLIVLASEARRLKSGSAEDLVQSLTDYVDKAGDAIGERVAGNPKEAGRLSGLLQRVEAEVNSELQSKAMPDEVRQMGQQKLRHRLQRSITDLKGKAVLAQLRDSAVGEAEKVQFVLELFSDEKEMEDVMSLVRETLAKDVGDQVMAKVRQELATRRERAISKELPSGVYVKAVLDFFVKMEISRAARYDLPFTLLLLSFQGLPEDKASHERHAEALRGLQNVLIGDMRRLLRDSDFIGFLSFNRFLVVLPMTKVDAVPVIVRKAQEQLTRQVALPDGSRLAIRPRCGLAAFDKAGLNSYQKLYAEWTRTWQGDRGIGQ
ncbi:MAG TPA: hypothetical protein VK465_03440 [Fibrobacteria bacterium]|nr:hypothetical protein [Fibrobacteria bacterium]